VRLYKTLGAGAGKAFFIDGNDGRSLSCVLSAIPFRHSFGATNYILRVDGGFLSLRIMRRAASYIRLLFVADRYFRVMNMTFFIIAKLFL